MMDIFKMIVHIPHPWISMSLLY